MDPVTLATAVVASLTPYLVKGGQAFAAEVGKKAAAAGESLLKLLWSRWHKTPASEQRLTAFVTDPVAQREALTMALVAEVAVDEEFARGLEDLLNGEPPTLHIRQQIEDAESITGAEIQQMIRGRLTMDQTAKHVTTATGVKINKIG